MVKKFEFFIFKEIKMKKVLIIGNRGFIGNNLYKYLKKFYFIRKVSFKDLKKIKNNLNYFDFIINTSINKNYIFNKYNSNFDQDLEISKYITNSKTIYCFISTRKIYRNKSNLTENSKLRPICNYSKNKLITEKKLKKYLNNNLLILRVSNIIGPKKNSINLHETFIDIFQKNFEKGIIFDNNKSFKDFLSIDKFCQIIKKIISKKLVGTYNLSIGQKVYLNDLINWLTKYSHKQLVKKKIFNKEKSFYLNNNKLMSKIKIKNSIEELKRYCHKYSKINLSK